MKNAPSWEHFHLTILIYYTYFIEPPLTAYSDPVT